MSKEATVFVLDVGASMGEQRYGRSVTDLQWALEYMYSQIGPKILSGRKTDLVGVVGLNTVGTDNTAALSSEGFEHISIILPVQQILMPQIRLLQELHSTNVMAGDIVEALAVGVDMIMSHCRKLQYIKNLILLTNARGRVDPFHIEGLQEQIQNENIQLSIIGIDFDDREYPYKEGDKPAEKKNNEEILAGLCKKTGGICGNLGGAYEYAQLPKPKAVQPINSFKDGSLSLGDPAYPEELITIPIERYARTKAGKGMGASRFSALANQVQKPSPGKPRSIFRPTGTPRGQPSSSQSAGANQQDNKDGTGITYTRTYSVEDKNELDGKRVIEKEDLEKGYLYGRTLVHMNKEDLEQFTYRTEPGLQILGFMDRELLQRYRVMGETNIIVPRKFTERAEVAIYCLVDTLSEKQQIAVGRFVAKEGKEPSMVILVPEITPDFKCLVELTMPFAEDVRHYRFAPLDKVKTIKGETLNTHAYIPTKAMEHAVSDYVDALEISSFGREDGQPCEYMKADERWSPAIHRVRHAVQHAIFHPNKPLPEIAEPLLRFSHPPARLIQKNKHLLETVGRVCEIKKLPPRKRFKRGAEEEHKPVPLDVQALLSPRKQKREDAPIRISPQNIMDDFLKAWRTARYVEAAQHVYDALTTLINDSVGGLNYPKVLDTFKTWRGSAVDYDEAEEFNRHLTCFKDDLLAGKWGGDRTELWNAMKAENIGLVTADEGDRPELPSKEDAAQFFGAK